MSTAAVFTVDSIAASVARQMKRASAPAWVRLFATLLVDIGALAAAAMLTAVLTNRPSPHFLTGSEMVQLAVPIALLCAAGLYSKSAIHPSTELRNIFSGIAWATAIFGLTGDYSSFPHREAALVIGFVITAGCLALFRTMFRSVMTRFGLWLTPALVVGSGPLAELLVQTLEKNKHLGFGPFAVLDELIVEPGSYKKRHIGGGFDAVTRIAKQHGVSHMIIADPTLTEQDLETLMHRYRDTFEHVILVSGHSAIGSLSVHATDLGGLLGLEVAHNSTKWSARVSKRVLDVMVASLGGLAFLPAIAALYLAVRLSSPGPVFYGQRRIGRNGRYFTAWKFRSMVTNADEMLRAHLAQDPELRREWELNHKLRNDPRVFPVGNFLRKTSLDELPQLWNVIRGEMSLVGPRPIVDAEVPRYGDSFDYYKMVRPGVTGMWQISGRSNTSYAERVRYDEYFVKNWSIWLDVYILFRTVKTVLLREGAC